MYACVHVRGCVSVSTCEWVFGLLECFTFLDSHVDMKFFDGSFVFPYTRFGNHSHQSMVPPICRVPVLSLLSFFQDGRSSGLPVDFGLCSTENHSVESSHHNGA